MTDRPAGLDAVLEWALDEIARRVVERLRQGDLGMVDQAASPLGRRRHCAMVRHLRAAGDARVAIVGRRHLATREAVESELVRIGKQPSERSQESVDLLRELGLVERARGMRHTARIGLLIHCICAELPMDQHDSGVWVGQKHGPKETNWRAS